MDEMPIVPNSPSPAPDFQPSPPTGYLVHDLVKGLEVSFGIEASQVERQAMDEARAWAEKGLPRHDLTGPVEIEEVLRLRASHVLADWGRRVRGRIEGAIHASCEGFGRTLVTLEHQLLKYGVALESIRHARAALHDALARDKAAEAAEASEPRKSLTFTSRIARWRWLLLCAILVTADFVANVPVFGGCFLLRLRQLVRSMTSSSTPPVPPLCSESKSSSCDYSCTSTRPYLRSPSSSFS